MKLFLNDKPVKIIKLNKPDNGEYDAVLNGKQEITSKNLTGNVLIEDASFAHIERLFRILEVKKLKKLKAITFSVKDKESTSQFIKDQFKIIKASGGIVRKNGQVLLIYRLKKWDLPKGKLKKKEDPMVGAKREVEEECNIKVEVHDKFCNTWHTYIRKGKRILKKTTWYLMDCINDSAISPQIEEYIDEVRWMNKEEVQQAMANSYKSIEEVFNLYYKDRR